jgi:signal transduction histidine kinase
MDNAQARCDGIVLVEVHRAGGAAVLTVTADPPLGPSPAQIFTRLDTVGDRSGLDLSIARAIAHVHGGTLEVRGTASFTLRLPATNAG